MNPSKMDKERISMEVLCIESRILRGKTGSGTKKLNKNMTSSEMNRERDVIPPLMNGKQVRM